MESTAKPIAMTERDVATALGVSPAALRKWRGEGRGPKWVKLGRLVRYRLTDLETWLAMNLVNQQDEHHG